ncbi:unnamed protein product [Pocillopora meandrina]|uniref:Uncharacterized protein n=1 Tax=Pocillopora meandrina TaxID=46732 RepID=A0AAU9XZH6_9CNID|nr:unnamed protein product [Pocillopora meandrina]
MHCPANVTLITGGAGVAVREEELYVCDQGDGTIRVVNMRSLFFHASRIGQEDPDAEESQKENVPDLVSPFAICAATKDNFELYVSDFCLSRFSRLPVL